MKKSAANLPASVRQRLLNLATERKEDFGLVLTRYGLERFLYRLSVSPHRDSFVLKGALLLQLWTAETYRPTRDLDLLGRGISNIGYRKIFSEVCSQKVEDDGLMFFQTRFVWKESVMMKPTKAFGCAWKHGLAMCAFLCRLTSVSETRLFRHQRNWNIPRSSNFLHLNCMPIPRRALLRKSLKPRSNWAWLTAE